MSLRFQKQDQVDRAAKEASRGSVLALSIAGVPVAVLLGVSAWLGGESLASYGKDLFWLIAFVFVYWIVAPFYYEFRFRSKEIDGKVSAIEAVIVQSTDQHADSTALGWRQCTRRRGLQ